MYTALKSLFILIISLKTSRLLSPVVRRDYNQYKPLTKHDVHVNQFGSTGEIKHTAPADLPALPTGGESLKMASISLLPSEAKLYKVS